MNRGVETLKAFTMSIPDDERHLRIVESPIWDNTINPAIGQVAELLLVALEAGDMGLIVIAPILRVLFEVLYVLGYHEGAKQKRALTFVCPEEASDDQP